jgi:hypothetical protein
VLGSFAHRADILICAVFHNVRYLFNLIIYNKNDLFHDNINDIELVKRYRLDLMYYINTYNILQNILTIDKFK